MFGELTPEAIESLLHSEIFARIAYVDRRGVPYIVPITYAYDGEAIYGYSLLGAKIEYMSAHPEVCVEVDKIESAADWRSVTARGTFRQVHGQAAELAVERISDRLRTYAAATSAPVPAWKSFVARSGGPGIAYRIDVTAKQGRYSTSD
ncbi:MAG: pyridoxamine 5'-phosphate oxidase family protein [Candidatus Eremiobacteraeota bacterium]|nr:pyridoxamine 5'-phosphate oxidase family protein [Candidatus Eremiobacteraeota bacterium]MBV9700826.1 pyridoxamine 5'-phosphate oxidase family protein [Candidatus Eremiobacteraeota bacterium]